MLQGRLFSYGDAQRYRLSVNFNQIPVNAPKCPVHSYHSDGTMRVDGNAGGATSYEPNTRGEWLEQPDFREPPLSLDGAADHWSHRVDDDHYSRPGALFRLMSTAQQQVLFENTDVRLPMCPSRSASFISNTATWQIPHMERGSRRRSMR
jgi:catalase